MRSVFVAHMGLVLAGMVSFVLMGAGQALFGPALPVFAREFGIATGQAGLLVSAHWVGAVLGVAAMYLRGDRVTPRMALAAMGLGAALVGARLGWGPTLLGALGFGLGYGGTHRDRQCRLCVASRDRHRCQRQCAGGLATIRWHALQYMVQPLHCRHRLGHGGTHRDQ